MPAATDEQTAVAEGDDGVGCPCTWSRSAAAAARALSVARAQRAQSRDFCTALEGVSHFHFMSGTPTAPRRFAARPGAPAEVDKYAAALRLILAQREGRFPRELFRQIIRCGGFPARPDTHRARTLRRGASLAARFCRRLGSALVRTSARPDALLQELRRFYLLGRTPSCATRSSWSWL